MKRLLLFPLILQLTTYNLQLTHASAATLEDVEKAFLEGRYERCAEEARGLIDARSHGRDELYYLKGLSEIKLKRFKESRESFEAIIAKYSVSKRMFDAYLGIGDSYFLEGNTAHAARNYKEILSRFPNSRNLQIVRSRLEDCYKKAGLPAKPAGMAIKPADLGAGGDFSVQIGYFKNRRNAERLSQKLRGKGYDGFVEMSIDSNGDRFYRAKVGRYKSEAEARVEAANLAREGYKTRICEGNACR